MASPRKHFEEMAERWILELEREYWEGNRCQCKERLVELLQEAYELNV